MKIHHLNKQKVKKIILSICISTLLICTRHLTAQAAAPDTSIENQAEAEAFIRDFYETLTEESLAVYMEKMDHSFDASDCYYSLATYKAIFVCGFQGYDNIVTTVYPLSDENYQIVFVQYDALFQDIDIGFPGSTAELVHKQEDGQWGIIPQNSISSELYLYDEIVQIINSDDFTSATMEVSRKYDDIILANPDVIQWLSNLADRKDLLLSKYMQEGFDNFLKKYIEKDASEKETPDTYTVQKGDCLWDIAENIFGNGLRWAELYEGNKDIIGDDPDMILTGILLQL